MKLPDITIDARHAAFCENSVETDKQRAHDTKQNSFVAKIVYVAFFLYSQDKTKNNETTAGNGTPTCPLMEYEVAKDDIEDRCESSCNIVKRNIEVLQAQIVSCDHSHEDHRQSWHHIFRSSSINTKWRERIDTLTTVSNQTQRK